MRRRTERNDTSEGSQPARFCAQFIDFVVFLTSEDVAPLVNLGSTFFLPPHYFPRKSPRLKRNNPNNERLFAAWKACRSVVSPPATPIHTAASAMPETTQETCTSSAKESPFFIKNLLNCDSKPAARSKPALLASKVAPDGGLPLSQLGDFNFPRFELPTQRFSLPAHYLERTSAWWYPYALSSSSNIHRSEGESGVFFRALRSCSAAL